MLVVPYSRIFDVVPGDDGMPDAAQLQRLTTAFFDPADGEDSLSVVSEPAPQSISLNVSNRCNLSCGYCYAGQGGFAGAQATSMDQAAACLAIDQLVSVADPSRPITIGFMGGEPFANRALIHGSVDHANAIARRSGLDVRFQGGCTPDPGHAALLITLRCFAA